jgi:hypothetical protein
MKTTLALSLFLLAAIGCTPSANNCTGVEAKWVVNALLLPQQTPASSNYSFDLNGDMKPDNALLGLVTALSSQGLSVQDGVNDSIGLGNLILLLDETGANLDNSNCAQTVVTAGQPFNGGNCSASNTTCATGTCYISARGNTTGCGPKYDGSETFTSDPSTVNAQFRYASIINGAFTSSNPATTKVPVSLTLPLPLINGAPPIPLPLQGARLAYWVTGTTVTHGQINGAVAQTDIQNTFLPAAAKVLDARVQADPTSSANQNILTVFDTGAGCGPTDYNFNSSDTDFDTSSLAKAGDGRIALCEVASNAAIKNVLKPDVELFDANGNYWPSAANATPNAFSVGLGFTAVSARF